MYLITFQLTHKNAPSKAQHRLGKGGWTQLEVQKNSDLVSSLLKPLPYLILSQLLSGLWQDVVREYEIKNSLD